MIARRRFTSSLLLVAVLILSVAISVQPPMVNANPGNTWVSRPGAHVDPPTIPVTNPTYAYDENPGTYASFVYSYGDGGFELINFTTPTVVVPPLPNIESVDFNMRYYAAPNTATSPDDIYRITYYVNGTPAAEPLVDWTFASRKDLYVDYFDNNKTDWTRVGSPPYLGAIDYPTNYINETMGVLLRPDNNGIYTAWTGDYTDWDDITPDGNATYVSAAADNLNESSTIADPSLPLPTGRIDKVMVTINTTNTEGSDEEVMIMVVIDGKGYDGHQEIFKRPSYLQIESYWVVNPKTNLAWTWEDINNLEVGVRSVQVGDTWTGEIRVTQMFVEVLCVDAKIGDFSFEDIDPSFDVGKVELEIYTRGVGPAENDQVKITLYDGTTWSSIGTLTPSSVWDWKSVVGVDVTSTLDTPAKINAAKVYLTKEDPERSAEEEIEVDAMRLRVYTRGYLEEADWVTWADKPRPGDGNWTWTDISNLQFAVETDRTGGQDAGCAFELYEAFVTVNLPNAKVTVRPKSVIDYSLKPQTPKTIRPNANGRYTGWTGDYTDWNETTQDGDTTYVSTTAAFSRESSNLEDPVHETWEIAGVKVVAYARYATGGMDELLTLTLVFQNRFERTSPEKFSLTTSYEKYSYTWAYNPYTEALWTWADIDGLQAGVLSEAVGDWTGEMRVTQLYVEIIGPRLTVDVKAEDVTNLYAYSFNLSYETTALTAVGALSAAPFGDERGGKIEDTITTKTNEYLGEGNNQETVFYLDAPPVLSGTETIYLDGVPQTRYVDYSINYETGEITFTTAPGWGVYITADYEYPAYLTVQYSMAGAPEEGASGNRTLATIIFVVEGYGRSVLDLHDVSLADPEPAPIASDEYDGYFRNTFLGDVDGDGDVDGSDLLDLNNAYGSKPGDPNWNPDCDFNLDDKVDASDLFDLGKNYGESMP